MSLTDTEARIVNSAFGYETLVWHHVGLNSHLYSFIFRTQEQGIVTPTLCKCNDGNFASFSSHKKRNWQMVLQQPASDRWPHQRTNTSTHQKDLRRQRRPFFVASHLNQKLISQHHQRSMPPSHCGTLPHSCMPTSVVVLRYIKNLSHTYQRLFITHETSLL